MTNTFDNQSKVYDPFKVAVDLYRDSRTHYHELNQFLVFYLAKQATSEPDYRAGARRGLLRLSPSEFYQLSSDCYEELLRRTKVVEKRPHIAGALAADVPTSLPIRDDIHAKRNAARQKLAAFTLQRFMDLLSDIHYELLRRYPEFRGT